MSNLVRWCVAYGRPPHVPEDPPSITAHTDRGPVQLCRPCWHRWNHGEGARIDVAVALVPHVSNDDELSHVRDAVPDGEPL